MEKINTSLPGVFLVKPPVFNDHRGSFVKTYHAGQFREWGVEPVFEEEFYSKSKKHVVRGMHFQRPPQDHAKLVFCQFGSVLDVVLDLRRGSLTFGQYYSIELSESNRLALYIPTGLAHGFLSLEEDSLMVYKTTRVHSSEHDAGIRWDSFGFNWGVTVPVISTRDAAFASFREYTSPF
jgi:dTDP-4-dehydrorhamnose 3,5-epimerase